MRAQIAPSILSFDPADYRTPVTELQAAGVDWIHLDVMDGQFVPPITFGAELAESLAAMGSTPVEAHLMTLTPERHFEAFVSAGCKRVIFHQEATSHAHRLAQTLREMGVQAGIAINPGTPVSAIAPLLGSIDLALVMTVNPGWGGQRLIESCIEKVRQLRTESPALEIEVDGGVTPATLPMLQEAGAGTFVVGSYLAGAPTIVDGVQELRKACLCAS